MEKRKKGSGSKENVGRKHLPYSIKQIRKSVPNAIYDKCLSLIDAELLKFKNNL